MTYSIHSFHSAGYCMFASILLQTGSSIYHASVMRVKMLGLSAPFPKTLENDCANLRCGTVLPCDEDLFCDFALLILEHTGGRGIHGI